MKPIILLTTFCLVIKISGYGQGIFESEQQSKTDSIQKGIVFNGYVRASVFGASKLFDYSSLFTEFSLQSKFSHEDVYLYSDIRFRNGLNFDKKYTVFQIKETYAGYQSNKFDVFLGNQIVKWGRTDGFNPTNNFSPKDYFFLSSDHDDRDLSTFMLRMKYRISPAIDIDFITIPVYRASNYRYDLFDIGKNVNYKPIVLPEKIFKNASFAARLNFEYPQIGFSVSYFRGYDPFFGFKIDTIIFSTGTPVITDVSIPYFKNTIGTDFALPVSSWIFRAEAAYNITTDYESNMYIPNPDITYVTALEHKFWGITTILQYIGKYTFDFTDLQKPVLFDPTNPSAQMQYADKIINYESALFNRKMFYQQEKNNHAVMLVVNKNFAYDTWKAELAGYYNITSEDLLIRPQITWEISDMLSTTIGGTYMQGTNKSVFEYSAPVLSGVFVQIKASF